MSSMDSPRHSVSLALRNGLCGLAALVALSMPTRASDAGPDSDGSAWDRARAQLIAGQQGPMALAISRWELLTSSNRGFSDYAGFLLSYPGFPEEERLRRYAEAALDRDASSGGGADVRATVAYFDRQPPLTNPGRARYALALRAGPARCRCHGQGGVARRADERCRRGGDPGHLGRHVHARRCRCADGRAALGRGDRPGQPRLRQCPRCAGASTARA
jgi:soluble lytic murein transglycosylase